MTGVELGLALYERFGSKIIAAKVTGFSESTIEKWRHGTRSPRAAALAKCLAILDGDDPEERELRILNYTQQIKEKRRIKWPKEPLKHQSVSIT